MKTQFVSAAVFLVAATLLPLSASAQNAGQPSAESSKGTRGDKVPAFWVREGFRVDLAAEGFGQSRFLETDGAGTVFVSQPDKGTITALTDSDGDGVYETKKVISTGRNKTHGMQFYNGMLYFTTPEAIFRLDPKSPEKVATVTTFDIRNAGGGHWWRSLLIQNDTIYTSIGDPGNINDETATPREKIWKLKLDPASGTASQPELYATGIRNTEKLRARPGTTEVWGCDHGSDNLGSRYGEQGGGPITDVLPPCEFNNYVEGFDYGHPFIVGVGLPRQEYAQRPDILDRARNNTPPAWNFGAHWAPNGWTFLASDKLGMKGDAIVALHGSWNSSRKVGYRIERVRFDPVNGRPYGAQMLVGTLDDSGAKSLGRPVDCLEMPDGSVLFSDDQTSRIYRLSKKQVWACVAAGNIGKPPTHANSAASTNPVENAEPLDVRPSSSRPYTRAISAIADCDARLNLGRSPA